MKAGTEEPTPLFGTTTPGGLHVRKLFLKTTSTLNGQGRVCLDSGSPQERNVFLCCSRLKRNSGACAICTHCQHPQLCGLQSQRPWSRSCLPLHPRTFSRERGEPTDHLARPDSRPGVPSPAAGLWPTLLPSRWHHCLLRTMQYSAGVLAAPWFPAPGDSGHLHPSLGTEPPQLRAPGLGQSFEHRAWSPEFVSVWPLLQHPSPLASF